MKTRFSLITDTLFLCFIAFILSLVVFNYFVPHPYSLIYSALVSTLITLFFVSRFDKKHKAERLKREEIKEKDALMSELNFSDRAEQNAIIENALKKAGLDFERKRGIILVKEKDSLILNRFSFNKVNKADIVRAFNLINKSQTAYVFAQDFDQDTINFAERFDGKVVLVGGNKIYKYLKQLDALPENYKYKQFTERKKKGNLRNLLDRKKAKTFFVFGLMFLLFSYISPLKVYYIVCGCSFLIYSLILKLFGKRINLSSAQADNN